MDPDLRARWVAALRSGKYSQGVGRLRVERLYPNGSPSFCCLGVLCDIQPERYDHDVFWYVRKRDGKDVDGSSGAVATANGRWVSPFKDEPTMKERKTVATMNDTGASFDEIANYIEENM